MVRSMDVFRYLVVISALGAGVLAMNSTKTVLADESFLFDVNATDVNLEERSLHKPSSRQFSAPVLYSSSYASPVTSSLTQPPYGASSSYNSPSTAQIQTVPSPYGGSAALTSNTGSATSYGGSYSNSYSTQLGSTSALISDLYGSGSSQNFQQVPSQQVNSNLYAGSYGQSAPAAGNLQSASSYGSPSAPLVAAPAYAPPSAPLVSAPSYGAPSAPLVAAPSYGTPSAPLVSAPSYGTPSAPLVSAPSYNPPSAPLISAPSYGAPSGQLISAPAPIGYSPSPVYGSPSAPLTGTPAPVCTQNMYNLTIPDNTPTGVVVLRVLATDPQGLPLRYTILDPIFGTFIINSQTGDIVVAAGLRNFGAALEFNVQVTNSQGQLCVSSVRINFITTTPLTTAAPYYGGSSSYTQPAPAYGSGSSNLVAAPSPSPSGGAYGSSGSSNLVSAPAPNAVVFGGSTSGGSYGGSGSSNLISVPAPASSYGGGSSNLVSVPAPATSYGSGSSNLAAAPAPNAVIFSGGSSGSYGGGSASLTSGSSYGGGSSSLMAAPAPTPSYGGGSSNLVAAPAPNAVIFSGGSSSSYGGGSSSLTSGSGYGGGSSNLVAAPAPAPGYGGGSSSLIAAPAPVSSYGGGSSNLVSAPAPASSYGGSSNLIAAPAPNAVIFSSGGVSGSASGAYGGGSSNLVVAPASAANYGGGGSYGGGNANLVAAPIPSPVLIFGGSGSGGSYGGGSSNLVAPAPAATYGGSGSSNLVAAPSCGGGGSYGSGSSACLTAPAPANSPYVAIMSQGQSTGGYGGGGGSANLISAPAPAPVTCPAICYANGGGNGGGAIPVGGNLFNANGGGNGGGANPFGGSTFNAINNVNSPPPSNPFSVTANLIATAPPFTQILRAPTPLTFFSSGPKKGLESDSVPPTPSTMNWSFFVPSFSGMTTVVGTLNGPSSNSIFTLSGNPFFVVDQTGTVSLFNGYCPPRSPMQEQIAVRAASADGSAVVQGSLSVVVFLTPSYLRICNSQPSPPPPTVAAAISQMPTVGPTRQSPASPAAAPGGVTVSFIGDSSFAITRCDGATGIPQVAATIRAKFSPNVDFSQLRVTISNSLFKPALPVVCDQSFTCDISIVFSQPLDSSFAGSYVPFIELEGGGLTRTTQQIQIQILCNDPAADSVPLPSRRAGLVDPSKIVPELQPCGVANISVDVSEDVPVGTVVTNLPSNGNPGFHYQILDSSAVGYFDLIDPASVAISSPLFQPTVDSVYLRVVGVLANSTVCQTDVFIGIKNVNRNRPVFDQPSYNFAIDCLLPMSLVGTVSASDIDAGRNNIRRFFVAPEDTALVLVDPASGGVHLRQTLTDSTSFTMFVENPGTPLKSSAVVQISCTGNNQVTGLSLGRSFHTTTKSPVALKTVPARKHPAPTSNKPTSFPFSVVFSSGGASARTNQTRAGH